LLFKVTFLLQILIHLSGTTGKVMYINWPKRAEILCHHQMIYWFIGAFQLIGGQFFRLHFTA